MVIFTFVMYPLHLLLQNLCLGTDTWACEEIGPVRAGALMRVERSESKTGS